MAIQHIQLNNVSKLTIDGRFDFQIHREFKDSYTSILSNPQVTAIEIDLSRANYIDSSALGMLMLFRERASAVNKSVALTHPSPEVQLILEVANFNKIFTIVK